jgi:hypothetical protein
MFRSYDHLHAEIYTSHINMTGLKMVVRPKYVADNLNKIVNSYWNKSCVRWKPLNLNKNFPVSVTKKCSEKPVIWEHWGSHWETDESTDRVIKKWFPGMLPRALRALAEVRHCPRELLWRKCCVNRYKVTYFCVLNQIPGTFWNYLYIVGLSDWQKSTDISKGIQIILLIIRESLFS